MYDQVNGLKAGNEIRFAGVTVGTVQEIGVVGNKVKVVAKIDKDVHIPEDSRFSVGVDYVMGAKFVTIDPPEDTFNSKMCVDGQEVRGTPARGLDEFMASSSKVLEKVEKIADAFNNVFGDPEVQKSMREGFLNTRDITKNLSTFSKVMADSAVSNQQEIAAMVAQMNAMSQRMNSVASHLDSLVTSADDNGRTGKNVAQMAENLATASHRIEEMSKTLEGITKDPKTAEDLKATIHNTRETTEKANKILGIVSDAEVRTDIMYQGKKGRWRYDMGVNLPLPHDNYAYIGGAKIGDGTKLDLQFGKNINDLSLQTGIMQGDFGVGVGYKFGNSFRLFTDIYDFSDTKVRLGGEVFLGKQVSLIGGTMDLRKNKGDNAYIGLRSYF